MAKLALSSQLFKLLDNADPQLRGEIRQLVSVFLKDSRLPGLDLEQYEAALDPKFRTVRLNKSQRGIVWSLGEDMYLLDDVVSHDEAARAARRKRCRTDGPSGQIELIDVSREEANVAPNAPPSNGNGRYLLEAISDKDLVNLGVKPDLLRLFRLLVDTRDLDALASYIPPREKSLAYMLASGYTVEAAWAELEANRDGDAADDLGAAIRRTARAGQLVVIDDEDDLKAALDRSFDAWRVFLHASQRELAEKKEFGGPVRVIGGPGTGKTVVALHRARKLVDDLGILASTAPKVLFVAFSTNVDEMVRKSLLQLGGKEIRDRVEVTTVDHLSGVVANKLTGERMVIATDDLLPQILEPLLHGLGLSADDVLREWNQVILAQDLRSLDAYLAAERRGTGRSLREQARREMWAAIERLTQELQRAGKETFLQRAQRAADALANSAHPLYDHCIVDEAQDLHAVHWRMLRALVKPGPNDLFIVGDAHQRIYHHRSPLSAAGIDCRGRNRRLVLNYRNSASIVTWARKLLGATSVDDLDGGADDLKGYHSAMSGPAPTQHGFPTREVERNSLAQQLKNWEAEGIPPEAVAVLCYRKAECKSLVEWFGNRQIGAVHVEKPRDGGATGKVNVITMHRSKGLEFRAVALVGASADSIPSPSQLASAGTDSARVEEIWADARNLLFTAGTRPRDRLWVSWVGDSCPLLAPCLEQQTTTPT